MQQFKITEENFKKLRKRSLTIMISLAIIIILIVVVVNIFSAKTEEVNTLPFTIPLVAALISFSFYRSLRQQKKLLLSYSVTISGEGLTREQLNTPPLSISFMEIKEILKTKKGSFMIKGVDRTDVIHIPYWVGNPEELEERLRALAPITVATGDPFYKKYKVILFILAIGMFIYVSKILVGISGVSSYIFFIAISILVITITKLTGGTWGPH